MYAIRSYYGHNDDYINLLEVALEIEDKGFNTPDFENSKIKVLQTRFNSDYDRITSYNVCYTKLLRVSDTMQTFDPRVYAVGECVQHRGICYGLVAPLFEQAKVAANHLANLGIARYVITSYSIHYTKLYEGKREYNTFLEQPLP